MSDPRYTDPRTDEPPLHDDLPRRPLRELDKSNNAMWGWIAGGIVLALLLVFVFGRTPSTDTASTTLPPPGESTLSPPTSTATPPPAAQRPSPSTTGQGGAQ